MSVYVDGTLHEGRQGRPRCRGWSVLSCNQMRSIERQQHCTARGESIGNWKKPRAMEAEVQLV